MRTLLLLLLGGSAIAGELVTLQTGFEIRVERHEVRGDVIHFHTGAGEIQLPASSVARIEPDDYVPPPSPAQQIATPPSPRELIDQAAERYGLPREFLHSVAAVESSYQANAVSPKGAIGIMQLMPGTAELLKADPTDQEQNVDAGARHLRDLLLKYDGGVFHALAAYNAGAGAVNRYDGIPPYRETQLYVQKVMERYRQLSLRQERTTDD